MADLDDQATFCPHCAQRIARPVSGKNTVTALVLAGLVVLSVYLMWTFLYSPWRERQRARVLMESAYQLCFPSTADDPATQELLENTRSAIRHLNLDGIEKSQLDNAFESGLNARGCGYNSLHALKPRKKKR